MPRDHLLPENVSGACSLMRAMSFSLGCWGLGSAMKILATDKGGELPSSFEPALTFQLGTSRYFLGIEMARSGGIQALRGSAYLGLGPQVC